MQNDNHPPVEKATERQMYLLNFYLSALTVGERIQLYAAANADVSYLSNSFSFELAERLIFLLQGGEKR